MTLLWHHLLTRDLLEACQVKVRHGWEVDALMQTAGGAESRLHVAEVIARSASVHDLHLPPEDGALLFVLRFNPVPRTHWSGGTLLRTRAGALAYAVGDGRIVESIGRALAIVTEPGDRYTHGFRIPGTTHH